MIKKGLAFIFSVNLQVLGCELHKAKKRDEGIGK